VLHTMRLGRILEFNCHNGWGSNWLGKTHKRPQ
jgi:hypothetical protein